MLALFMVVGLFKGIQTEAKEISIPAPKIKVKTVNNGTGIKITISKNKDTEDYEIYAACIENSYSGYTYINEDYQKIEYQYEDDKNHIYIDFLLCYVPEEKTWKIWIGKIGACSYDDDPYKDLKTDKFSDAILNALDFVEEFIDKVQDDPQDYVQYYKDL